MEPMLSVRNLVKRFGGLTAVNRVSLDVYPGEVVGLVGDNAAGKSTLIKCISGVYEADEGEIFFRGKRIHFARPIDARGAGIETIYQDLALAGNLGVSANIFLGRKPRENTWRRVHTLDEAFMIEESQKVLDTLDIRFANFGEKRKIVWWTAAGRSNRAAIYWQAKLMIMDEPPNNLGVAEQRKVMDLIGKLREEEVPVILINHTLPDIFGVTNRIVVMHRGAQWLGSAPAKRTARKLCDTWWACWMTPV